MDLGSAITVDLVDLEGVHQGGLIIPGLEALGKALPFDLESAEGESDQTLDLPWAQRTEEAVSRGRWHLLRGFIDSVLDAAAQRLTGEIQLILTGGDAEGVFSLLSKPGVLDLELVRKGLERMALDEH
jgi:type III pantothenate kinase